MIENHLNVNSLTHQIIGLAIKVHQLMGPGLLESVYSTCLRYEMKKAGLFVEQEKVIPLFYDGIRLDQSYRIDLLVQGKIIIEVKVLESINTIHRAQLLSYLRLTGCPVGLLINFNVERLKEGVCRIVNNHKETSDLIAAYTQISSC